MIGLPEGFIPTPLPGYFIHVEEMEIYSIKSGTPKRLKKSRAWMGIGFRYVLSVDGKRREVTEEWIRKKVREFKRDGLQL